MTENLKKRLITVLVGVPLSLAVIFILPYCHFLAFSLVITVFCAVASYEMSLLVFKEVKPVVFFAWILPFSQYITNQFCLSQTVPEIIFALEILVILSIEIFAGEKDDFKGSLINCAENLLCIVYPSYFLNYLVRLTGLSSTDSYTLALFLILVFGNDIFAYVFGMLFGRNNAGILKVSPKKSIAGFIGSFASTIILSAVLCRMIDSIVMRILLGFIISLASNSGDLIESVFKRSAGVKDSGNIFPGRGGMLDCVDSLSAAAPVYYIFIRLAVNG